MNRLTVSERIVSFVQTLTLPRGRKNFTAIGGSSAIARKPPLITGGERRGLCLRLSIAVIIVCNLLSLTERGKKKTGLTGNHSRMTQKHLSMANIIWSDSVWNNCLYLRTKLNKKIKCTGWVLLYVANVLTVIDLISWRNTYWTLFRPVLYHSFVKLHMCLWNSQEVNLCFWVHQS